MRITGGKARGIGLRTAKGSNLRPATDRLREAVFSSLGSFTENARFLDLFAGSGAYGLEAWSRGASVGSFVEKERRSIPVLKQNIAAVSRSLGRSDESLEVFQGDVMLWEPSENRRYDLIFVDPPYEQIEKIVSQLFSKLSGWLAPEGRVIFEMPGSLKPEEAGWKCIRSLGKGRQQPVCRIYRKEGRGSVHK